MWVSGGLLLGWGIDLFVLLFSGGCVAYYLIVLLDFVSLCLDLFIVWLACLDVVCYCGWLLCVGIWVYCFLTWVLVLVGCGLVLCCFAGWVCG